MSEKEILEFAKQDKKVFIYGAGVFGRTARTFFSEHEIQVEAFVVTKLGYGERLVLDTPVIEVGSLNDEEKEGVFFLAVSEKYQSEVCTTLAEYGIMNYFVLNETIIQVLDSKCEYADVAKNDCAKVLLYHRVIKLKKDIWRLGIPPLGFEKQMRYLKQNYDIVRFEDIDLSISGRQIAITFDDGYADNYLYALPILDRLQIPATIFVSTCNLDSMKEFWWDEIERMIVENENCPKKISFLGKDYELLTEKDKVNACYDIREDFLLLDFDARTECMNELKSKSRDDGVARLEHRSMTSEELRAMDRSPYITIGGHTITHTRLTSQTSEQKKREIDQSKNILEEILGHDISTFSFPFGGNTDYDRETINLAINAGYKRIAAVQKRYREYDMAYYNPGRIGIQCDKSGMMSERAFRRALVLNG